METGAAVAGVVSTFDTGADLVQQIRKRSKKKRGEQAIKEKLLQEALESGEKQISDLYTKHLNEAGAGIRIGDALSREKLQHIAVSMQSELIRSLQIALKFDNAKLDLTKLQEDAVMSKRDTMTVLDELRSRIQQSSPQDTTSQMNRFIPRRPSLESIQTSMSIRSASSNTHPSTVTIPAEAEESRGSISRLLSMRRHSNKRMSTSSSISSPFIASLLPTTEMLMPGLLQRMDEPTPQYELSAGDVDLPLRDVKVPIPEPDTDRLHPALVRENNISRHTSTSTRGSTRSDRSDFSDEKIAVVAEENEEDVRSPSSPPPAEIAYALPPQHNQILYSASYATQLQPIKSPTSTISTASMLPSPITLGPGSTFDYSQRNYQRPHSSSTSSSLYSPTSAYQPGHNRTISLNSVTANTSKLLTGRPDKQNNYWGFCKGSWTIRSEWRKGLSIYEVPTGMYNSKTVWRCKHCSFEGDVFGSKKPYDTDQKVYQTGDSGVRYRWLFLAKSHTKRKQVLPSMGVSFLLSQKEDNHAFGCVFCVGEGRETAIFGNVETLCEHLVMEHGSLSGMSEKVMAENKCIVGRRAGSREDFDVNIPHVVEVA